MVDLSHRSILAKLGSAIVLIMCWQLMTVSESAEPPVTAPAEFVDGPQAFASMLKAPSYLEEGIVAINCMVEVNANGYVAGSDCLSLELKHRTQIMGIKRALNGHLFKPARLNGQPVSVLAYFTVIYSIQGDVRTVDVVPNLALNVSTYGSRYIAPQWASVDETPSIHCASSGDFNITMDLGESGVPTNLRLQSIDITESCRKKVLHAYRNSRYIPAHLDETPIEVTHQHWYRRNAAVRFDQNPGISN